MTAMFWSRIYTCCTGLILERFPFDEETITKERVREIINNGILKAKTGSGDSLCVDSIRTFTFVMTTTTDQQGLAREILEEIGFVSSAGYSKTYGETQREKASGSIEIHTIHAVDLANYKEKLIQKESEKESKKTRRFNVTPSRNEEQQTGSNYYPHATEEDFFSVWRFDLDGYPHDRDNPFDVNTVSFNVFRQRYGLNAPIFYSILDMNLTIGDFLSRVRDWQMENVFVDFSGAH